MKITTICLAALSAAALALASCSKESSDLKGSQNSGKPFVIQIENGCKTRGEAISSINSFKMVGVQGTSSSPWIDNYQFTQPQGIWVATDHANLSWPGGSDTHTFYGICDNTETVTDITSGQFEYTVPSDISSQKDLLVSLNENQTDGEVVSLNFKHALSSVKFKIGFNRNEYGGDLDSHIKVTKITLHHIATKGTFNFANFASNPWTVDPDDAEYVDYVITLKTPIEFGPTEKNNYASLNETYIDANSVGEIYVIPHLPTAWSTNGEIGHPLADSYIGVTCQFYYYTGEVFADYAGIDEDSDEDDINDAKEMYVDDGGQLSTSGDEWLNDRLISVVVPTSDDYDMNVYAESHLTYRNQQAEANGTEDNYEEVFIPLTMTNGFGFNKTNIININMDQIKRANGKDFFHTVDFELP